MGSLFQHGEKFFWFLEKISQVFKDQFLFLTQFNLKNKIFSYLIQEL